MSWCVVGLSLTNAPRPSAIWSLCTGLHDALLPTTPEQSDVVVHCRTKLDKRSKVFCDMIIVYNLHGFLMNLMSFDVDLVASEVETGLYDFLRTLYVPMLTDFRLLGMLFFLDIRASGKRSDHKFVQRPVNECQGSMNVCCRKPMFVCLQPQWLCTDLL